MDVCTSIEINMDQQQKLMKDYTKEGLTKQYQKITSQ